MGLILPHVFCILDQLPRHSCQACSTQAISQNRIFFPLQHESISKMLFDAIHERNKKDFERYGLQKTTESDVDHILFIREQLEGKNYCKGVENIQVTKQLCNYS